MMALLLKLATNKITWIVLSSTVLIGYNSISSYFKTKELKNQMEALKNEIIYKQELVDKIHENNVNLKSKLDSLTESTNSYIKDNENECVFSSKFVEQLNSNIKEINKRK